MRAGLGRDAGAQRAIGAASPVQDAEASSVAAEAWPPMAPEGYTVIAARLAEAHGFEVVYLPGSMMSGTYLGVPDWGLISPAEMIDIAGRIARAVSIPVISDADQAGGTSLNVFDSVQQFERAGIAGIHIEDTINPNMPMNARRHGAASPAAISRSSGWCFASAPRPTHAAIRIS